MLRKVTQRALPGLLRGLAAAGAGLLLASAYPPFGYAEAAWVALVPLLLLSRYSGPFTAFRWGVAAGCVFWLISISWLLALSRTGGPLPLVVLGWILLAGYCALYIGAFCMVVAWVWQKDAGIPEHRTSNIERPTSKSSIFRCSMLDVRCWMFPAKENVSAQPRLPGVCLVILVPLLWVGFEYLRCVLLTGFPWNQLGVSQYRNVGVIQLAEWGGVYAVSALLVVVNTALALMMLRLADVYLRRRRSRFNVELMIGLVVWALCIGHGIRTVHRVDREAWRGPGIVVTAVQPNVPQLKKWPPGFAAGIYKRLERQTRLAAMQNPDLVVWPETAVPGAIGIDPHVESFVREIALLGSPLLVGCMEEQEVNREIVLYNSSFLFGADGRIVDRYRKCHLVPFGEYIPFERLVPVLKRMAPLGFSCASGKTVTVFHLSKAGPMNQSPSDTVQGRRGTRNAEGRSGLPLSPSPSALRVPSSALDVAFSALICFEDTVARLARCAVLNGARLLVNQTNDAWFDGTCGAVQHMSHCVFRCVENRVPAVRCTNTGVTSFIDRVGRFNILDNDNSVLYSQKTERVVAAPADMRPTFYTRFGDGPFALPCGVAAAALFVLVVWREKRDSAADHAAGQGESDHAGRNQDAP